jgi:hypothetical protein
MKLRVRRSRRKGIDFTELPGEEREVCCSGAHGSCCMFTVGLAASLVNGPATLNREKSVAAQFTQCGQVPAPSEVLLRARHVDHELAARGRGVSARASRAELVARRGALQPPGRGRHWTLRPRSPSTGLDRRSTSSS